MYVDLIPTDVFVGSTTVLGDGPVDADYVFVGEAPGAEEDASGRPFVGPSGRLLSKLLDYYTDLRRPGVYVTNVVKHRPPDNRTPKAVEVKKYVAALTAEVEEVDPAVVVCLGAVAAKVFDKTIKITDDHGVARAGSLGTWTGIVVPWWHPSAALRFPDKFAMAALDASRLHDEVDRAGVSATPTDYQLVDESVVVAYLLQHWGVFGFDTETTSPTHGKKKVFATDEADMVGYSVSVRPGQGWYVATTAVGDGMAAILESPLWQKVVQNVKFEIKVLGRQGITLRGYDDTKTAAYLLGEPRTGLKTLAKQHLGVQPTEIRELWPEGIADQPVEVAFERYRDNFEYAAADADNANRLWPIFVKRMEDEELLSVYHDIEMLLTPVLARMENFGMNVDVDACAEASRRLRDAAREAEGDILVVLRDAGVNISGFNVDSRDQLEAALVDLGAPLKKKTDSLKRFKVDADVLDDIRAWNPTLIGRLLDYYKYRKMEGYVEGFVELRGPDGRLHTSFNQSGHWEEAGGAAGSAPATGRISSSGPNLQNIPNHRATVGDVDWGRILRRCLIASDGNVLMSADLGQEEPRIIAVVANDKTLLDGFHSGRDIYRPATEALYPSTIIDGSDADFKDAFEYKRFVGKTFFLAWYYGAAGGRLRTLDDKLQTDDVKRGLSLLSEAHPARAAYLDETRRLLTTDGYVTSLYGRRRWIPKIWSRRKGDREAAVREAANDRIQATAADILKIALTKIDRDLPEGARIVSTIHDEIVVDLPRELVPRAERVVRESFQGLLPGLELVVETAVGINWGEKERFSATESM